MTDLAELHRRRGELLEAGKPIAAISAQIIEAQQHADALVDQESERLRRERKAVAEVREKHISAQKAELEKFIGKYLEHVSGAEAGARQLVQQLGNALYCHRQMVALVADLKQELPRDVARSISLSEKAVVSRLSGQLGALLRTLPGYQNRFGGIECLGTLLYRPSADWSNGEQRHLHSNVDPILSKGKTNGHASNET